MGNHVGESGRFRVRYSGCEFYCLEVLDPEQLASDLLAFFLQSAKEIRRVANGIVGKIE